MNIFNVLDDINNYLSLPPGLLVRIAYQEQGRSWNFNLNARSFRGAVGLMQITPQTVQQIYNISRTRINPLDPVHSILGAGIYLKWLYSRFGSWPAAIAAYNWGYGNVRKMLNKYGSIRFDLLPKETQNYLSVAKDLGL